MMDSRVRNSLKEKNKRKKPNPRGSGLKRACITVSKAVVRVRTVGFPALTHDRVAVPNLHRIPAPTCLVS